jgi:predicted RNA methylase
MEPLPDLFGEPPRDLAKSQLFTPMWIARKLAEWIPRGHRVLEPACGTGNLLEGLLQAGHRPTSLFGVELDPRMADFALQRFDRRVAIRNADFFDIDVPNLFDVAVMNPPFENNAHARFVERALRFVPVVVGIFPVTFEFTQERDRLLWANIATVSRRAIFPERVNYAGEGGMFESVALRIVRREHPRRPGEQRHVIEETWTQEAA